MQEDLNVRMSKTTWSFGAREAFVLVVALLSALVAIGYQTRDAGATGSTFSLSSDSYNGVEGNFITITVERTGTAAGQANLTFTQDTAVPGEDYVQPGSGTVGLPFAENQSSRTFQLQTLVNSDSANKQLTVTISGVADGDGTAPPITATITILNNTGIGTVQFSQSSYTVTEGVGFASFGVTRTGGSNGAITAFCSTTVGPGTATANVDYNVVTNQQLDWGNGDTSTKFCQVAITQDGTIETSEQFGLLLTGGAVGSPSTATVTINDDDGVGVLQFSSATFTGAETGGAITITVTRTGSTTGQVTVDFATTTIGSTATAGVDYVATLGTLTWTNGDGTPKSFTVTPIADGTAEGTETVNLVLSNPTGGASLGAQSTAVLNITDSTVTPFITSIDPGAGPLTGGTLVTITGGNFVGTPSVTFGGLACTSVSVVLSTRITCVTPAHTAGTVEVIVTTVNGSNTTIGTQNDFTYTSGPIVTLVDPNTGLATGNTIVTITGTGFTSSGMTVKFGTVTAVFTYIDTTTIIAVAPAQSAGTVDVIVTTPGGTSPNTAADNFTYTGSTAPVVTSVSPASGPVGTTITIIGTGFTGATSVTVGGVPASFTVNSSTQITATVPTGTPAGVVDVRVTGPGGTSLNTAADNFTNTSSAQTVTYTLYFRFTLLVWTGKNNIGALAALTGQETPDNPQTNNVSASVGAIYRFNGATQSWEAYFPGSDSIPGANNFTTLQTGTAYFIALKSGGTMSWSVLAGP